jgi:large subunit ribosomal protein L33
LQKNLDFKHIKNAEVKLMRTRITLECTECKQRNYNTTKDKKTHPDRVETKKYCKFCQKHTLHKETK